MVHMLVPIEQTRWHTLYDTDYNVTRVWLRAPQDYIDVSNLAPLDQQPDLGRQGPRTPAKGHPCREDHPAVVAGLGATCTLPEGTPPVRKSLFVL